SRYQRVAKLGPCIFEETVHGKLTDLEMEMPVDLEDLKEVVVGPL
ncbi:9510_t:CDS:2, partial [Ambispora leptoticha]